MKYTPEEITKRDLYYTIPIYQRLFEWDTDNIITLLEDLKKEYDNSDGQEDYHIGMLTSTKDNSLVDGQQRFTVMMLLGCVLQDYHAEWKSFLMAQRNVRLDFTSRPLDNTYIRYLIEHKEYEGLSYKNLKMLNGLEQIRKFMENAWKDDQQRRNFSEYVYKHLCFFISDLPQGYSPRELNKYFERMNTSGKNLEQHEILKVKLLGNLDADIDKYMLLWNKLADTEVALIRPKEDEDVHDRKQQALKSDIATIFAKNLLNGLNESFLEECVSIAEIEPSASAPKKEREISRESQCALTFPHLLLQVLYRKLGKRTGGMRINEFFNPNNLLSIFEEFLPFSGNKVNKEDIKDFMERLVKARLALDICFVRQTEYGYSLDMNMDEDDKEKKKLMMFQSMLYVSSSNYTNYRWFNWLMDEVDKYGIPDAATLYEALKNKCDEEFPLPPYESITYNGDNRYWFWRLDFHIWKHRKELFEKDSPEMNIVENYVFKRNRSIEHVAPQTPQSNSMMKWDDNLEDALLRDCFGNLVMISQGLNSSLKNESYEVKTAHVRSYCNGSKSGSIESLKLLVIHRDYPGGWTKEAIKEHGKKMYAWLEDSYREDTNASIFTM